MEKKIDKSDAKLKLEKLQRLACLITLGGTKSTPTSAMEVMLNLPPLSIFLKYEAMKTNCRFQISQKPEIAELKDEVLNEQFEANEDLDLAVAFSDYIEKEYNFYIPFEVEIPDEKLYENLNFDDIPVDEIHFTDG